MQDCVFCKIVEGKIPTSKIFEDENVLAFNDIKPSAETHLVLISKKHIATFMDLNGEMLDITKIAQKLIAEKKLEEGYKLVINGGKYQEIKHFHMHLLAGKLRD